MSTHPSGLTVFEVVVLGQDGRLASQRLRAASLDLARQQVESSGMQVMQCRPLLNAHREGSFLRTAFSHGQGALDAVRFSQDMATLMEAGVTASEAIRALAEREQQTHRLQLLRQLDAAIAEGLRFSAALERTGAFPELLVATVAASEHTGDLAAGLSRYAQHLQSLRAARDRLVSACVYPALLLTVGFAIVLLLLGVVVPRFAVLIESTNKPLPWLSQLLMGWGAFANTHPLLVVSFLGAIVALLALGMAQLSQPRKLKLFLDRLPVIARVVRTFQHLQMYRTTAILTARGITVHKALALSTDLLSPRDGPRLQAALDAMREGVSMSRALFDSGLCDAVAMSMLNVAERSGSLPQVMDRLADLHERELQRTLDIASRLIEPLLMVVLGIVIGGIVLLMYLPIFDLAASIS